MKQSGHIVEDEQYPLTVHLIKNIERLREKIKIYDDN